MLTEGVKIPCLRIPSSSSAQREPTLRHHRTQDTAGREWLCRGRGRSKRRGEVYKWQRIRETQGPGKGGEDSPEACKTVAAVEEGAYEVSKERPMSAKPFPP